MTRISRSLYPEPVEQAQNPAGRTKAALAHGTKASSCRDSYDTPPSVTECCSDSNECRARASEATPRPQVVEGHHTIPQAFERLNAPQMRRDRLSSLDRALPPKWLMVVSAATMLLTLLIVSVVYPAFFAWMAGVAL